MTGRWAWVVAAYALGTLPSAYLVAVAKGGRAVVQASHRGSSDGDAHIAIRDHLGGGWAALAGVMDVGKGLVAVLAARRFIHLPPPWLALMGVGVVVGHTFPPYVRAMAGRGLAAAAGVLLGLLPVPMVVAGSVMLLGIGLRHAGPASTIGFASTPLTAALQGQPPGYVAMAGALMVVVVVRRLEGTGAMVRATGISWGRAALYRAAFDLSMPPGSPSEPQVDRARP